jgi:putative hydrolase of the HAD superfamily
VRVLTTLRRNGFRLGVLSDASPEIAAAWPAGPIAALVDAAVFSCETGCTKPDQRLYAGISNALGTPAHRTVYVGDGGGNELRGALDFGMTAVAVHRRGSTDGLAFGTTPWTGSVIGGVEQVSSYLTSL